MTQTPPAQPRSIPGPPLAWLLLGVATVLRFYHLGHQSLWVDEYASLLSSHPYVPLGWADLWENLHGPLHALSLHLLVNWIGLNTVTLRLPTAVAGVLTVAAMFRLGERTLGRGGVVAAALATFSPFLIWYSQEARNYAYVVLFAVLATWAWVEILRSQRLAWWAVYAAACAAGVLSNLSMLFVIATHFAHWVYLMIRQRQRFRSIQPWVWCGLVVVAVVSPWLWQLWRAVDWRILYRTVEASHRLERAVGLTWLAVPYTFFTFCLGFSMGPSPRELHGSRSLPVFLPHLPWLVPAALFFGWLTLRGVLSLRRRPDRLALVSLWLVVPLLMAWYLSMRNVKVFNPRYVAVSLPALFLLWTEAFLSLRRRLAWAAAAGVALLWGISLAHHYYDPTYNKDDVRGAAVYLARHWQPGDFLLTAGAAMPIHFYLSKRVPSDQFWLGFSADTVRLMHNFQRFVPRTCSRVWVVTCRPHWYDPSDNFRRFIERQRPLDHQELAGCTVDLLRNDSTRVDSVAGR